MLKIYNTRAITKQQRFIKGLIYGIPTSLFLAIIYGVFTSFISVEFSFFYLGIGYIIGITIQKTGKGVQISFSIMAAVLALLTIFFGDLISRLGFLPFMSFSHFIASSRIILNLWFSFGLNTTISLLFRGLGVYVAYKFARII